MRLVAKRLLWIVIGALALLMCLWLVSRLRGPSAAQAEALALMQDRAPLPPGNNAFPAIWLLAYDVPTSQLADVAENDIAQRAANPAMLTEGGQYVAPVSTAMEGFAYQAPSSADMQLFCAARDPDCIETIRANTAIFDGLIQRNQALLDRVVALQDYGYYRSREPASVHALMSPFQFAAYDITRVAWQFARGDADAAVAGACDGAHFWRRTAMHTNSLLAHQVSAAYVDGYARLLLRVLGELPADHPLPGSCDSAFSRPTVADASICEPLRGELALGAQLMQASLAAESSGSARAVRRNGLFDPEKTSAIIASHHAWVCSERTQSLLRQDQRVAEPTYRQGLMRLECVANVTGCLLAQVASPAYVDYQWKAQDHAARLELMAALLWLRSNANPDQTMQSQLTGYWEENRRGDRQIRFEDDGRSVALQQYARGPDVWWVLPWFPAAG